MWALRPARHAGIPPAMHAGIPPPVYRILDTLLKILPCLKLRLRAVITYLCMYQYRDLSISPSALAFCRFAAVSIFSFNVVKPSGDVRIYSQALLAIIGKQV